jgi:hypothetical protein
MILKEQEVEGGVAFLEAAEIYSDEVQFSSVN